MPSNIVIMITLFEGKLFKMTNMAAN